MLNKIIEFSVYNKLIVGIFIIGLIGFGLYHVTLLPIDAVPDITDNQVQVITQAPSFGSTDIERLITFPIEQATSNIQGIKQIRSFSRFGLSLVTIVFNDGIDIYWARQQVTERLQQAQSQIPKGIGVPELGPISTGLGEIYQYTVRPAKGYEMQYSTTELRTIQDWIIRPQLMSVKGVAEISSFGGKLKQYEITVHPDKLNAHNITLNDVFTALEKNNQNTGGAYIEKGPSVVYIRSEGLIRNIDDIKNISIQKINGTSTVFIHNVADVQIGYATRYGAICYNDKGEVAGAIVMMLKGANSSKVIKNVKERIEQVKTTLPKGVIIEPFLDRTKMVNNAISTVTKNLLEGALIVIFVLVLFLGNFRAGFLVATIIPLSMLFAIIMMNTFNVSGNLMSLGALDFGLIVDGAVIIVEAVMHKLHLSKTNYNDKDNLNNEVRKTSQKMMNSAVFGQIIILIVYLPIFTLQGIEGKMFKPMAQTVVFALLGAFILSLTYVPMMSALMLKYNPSLFSKMTDKVMEKVTFAYQKALLKALRLSKTILILVAVLFTISSYMLFNSGGEFIPALEEGDFAVDTRVLSGSNLQTTIDFTQKAAHVLLKNYPEVLQVVTKIGSGEVPTDPMPMEASDMMVILKDKKDWTSAKTFTELSQKMGETLSQIPGIQAGFQFPVQMRFNELMTGARQDVVCKIFGDNMDTLAFYANQLGKLTNTIKGSKNLYVEPVLGVTQIVIEYNRNTIAQYNLSIEDINRIVNTALAGQSSGLIFEEERRFELVVRLHADAKKNIDDIKNLLIPTENGLQIPLYVLANVEQKNGLNQIQRENAKRRIIVGFNIHNRDVESIVNELQQKVSSQIHLPSGYYITYGGSFENLQQAKNRLLIAVPVSLALIFLMLFLAFNNMKHAIIIYSAIPLSAIGGILLLAIRQMPFSISAGVGFIALFGVAVLNGIVLISEFNQIRNSGSHSLLRVVVNGTKNRLRPVLMTAFVASLGFLPMAISNGAGAEVQRPLATVVIGGLLLATFLTLFVLPILYLVVENFNLKRKSKMKFITLVLVLSSLMNVQFTFAQEKKISLQEALQKASRQNKLLKATLLHNQYLQTKIQTYKDVPKTYFGSELGQFNSNYFDAKIGASQVFLSRKVYESRKDLLTEEAKMGNIQMKENEKNIAFQVAETFNILCFTNEKLKQVDWALDKYKRAMTNAEQRFQVGSTSVVEKTNISNELNQILIKQKNLTNELMMAQRQLAFLLNDTILYLPMYSEFMFRDSNIYDTDTTMLKQLPILLYWQQQNKIDDANIAIEKSKLKPEIQGGAYLQTFRTAQSFNQENMGTFGQIGVSIPLFKSNIKNAIKALELKKNSNQANLDLENTRLQIEFYSLKDKLRNYSTSIEQYENALLKNAETLEKTTFSQYTHGDISYIEWLYSIRQNIDIRNAYTETVYEYNNTLIQLQNLLNNKQ